MLKVLAYILFAVSVMPFMVFLVAVTSTPATHGILPKLLAWLFSSVMFAAPFWTVAAILLLAHRAYHPAAHREPLVGDNSGSYEEYRHHKRVSNSMFGR